MGKFVCSNSKLIVCEGTLDLRVISQVLQANGIAGFDILSADMEPGGGGVGKIGPKLASIKINEDFIQNVEKIYVISDHDNGGALAAVNASLTGVSEQLPDRTDLFVPFSSDSNAKEKHIAVHLIPADAFGCIETVLVKSALEKWPALAAPLAAYKNLTPAATWSASDQSKMELECIIASTCAEMPEVSIYWLWQKAQEFHIPLNSPAFGSMLQFLKL